MTTSRLVLGLRMIGLESGASLPITARTGAEPTHLEFLDKIGLGVPLFEGAILLGLFYNSAKHQPWVTDTTDKKRLKKYQQPMHKQIIYVFFLH